MSLCEDGICKRKKINIYSFYKLSPVFFPFSFFLFIKSKSSQPYISRASPCILHWCWCKSLLCAPFLCPGLSKKTFLFYNENYCMYFLFFYKYIKNIIHIYLWGTVNPRQPILYCLVYFYSKQVVLKWLLYHRWTSWQE